MIKTKVDATSAIGAVNPLCFTGIMQLATSEQNFGKTRWIRTLISWPFSDLQFNDPPIRPLTFQ